MTLPAAYVREHVDPGYATTAHRAQGITVDTAHILTTPAMAREALYVAMTRGRHANHLYVPTDTLDSNCHGLPDPQLAATARQILTTILATSHRELSATETTTHAANQATALARLVPIRATLAAANDRHTWQQLAPAIGLTAEQTQHVLDSPAAGPLLATIRQGQAAGHPMERVLAQLIRRQPMNVDDLAGDQVVDLAAVLHRRVSAWLDDSPVLQAESAGDGDASEAAVVHELDLALRDDHDPFPQALRAVDALIRHRVDTLTDRAARPGWLPPDPAGPNSAAGRDAAAVLAAHRDLASVGTTGRTPLGRQQPVDDVQRRRGTLAGPALGHQTNNPADHDRSIR